MNFSESWPLNIRPSAESFTTILLTISPIYIPEIIFSNLRKEKLYKIILVLYFTLHIFICITTEYVWKKSLLNQYCNHFRIFNEKTKLKQFNTRTEALINLLQNKTKYAGKKERKEKILLILFIQINIYIELRDR